MKIFTFIFSLLLLMPVLTITAQDNYNVNERNCNTMEVYERLKTENPNYEQTLQEIEQQISEYLKNNPQQDNLVVTIPVVVHVVYNSNAENISTTQVQSQITVMNQDFRKLNPDVNQTPAPFLPYTADCQINFCLATVDPNGNATTGITRTKTKKRSFRTNDDVKFTSRGGKDGWPSNKYLNVWVCNLSNNILGYAQFPGGPASTDGVVIAYRAFGTNGTATYPFNLGRTATHEVGHWLNLRHIWGDDGSGCYGSDLVDDTPNQAGYYWGCPSFPAVSCSNGPNGAMFMNYMDYTDDRCMFMFTTGQSGRMNATISGVRSPILTSNGCGVGASPIVIEGHDNIINSNVPQSYTLLQNYPNPFNPSTVIKYGIPEQSLVTIKVYDITGQVVAEIVNDVLAAGYYTASFDASNLSAGIYLYEIKAGDYSDTKKMVLIK
jgi:hypothetical protein